MRSCSSKSYDPVISAHFPKCLVGRERALLASPTKRFQCHAFRGDLVVADDRGVARTARIGLLHLRLEAAARAEHHVPSRIAPLLGEAPGGELRLLAGMHDEDVHRGLR